MKNFNQYIILIPLLITPAILPLVSFYELYESPVFYLIPTQGTLILLKAAFDGSSYSNVIYSVLMLSLSVYLAYLLAKKHYIKFMFRVKNEKQ
ncbi:MAG: hypothetical protein HC906_00090 [Bacteroidales bacterium]|nr:hypothetical protein [Bacteroidales bacterium]